MMRTRDIRVRLRTARWGRTSLSPSAPPGAIIAIMEIWGVNDTMRRHAQESPGLGSFVSFRISSGARSRESSSTTGIPKM